MGWSWAAACGVQGRGHIVRFPAQLVHLCFTVVFLWLIFYFLLSHLCSFYVIGVIQIHYD